MESKERFNATNYSAPIPFKVWTTPVSELLYPAHHTWNLVPTGLLSQASISAPAFASSD
jgi:hypothetical protein